MSSRKCPRVRLREYSTFKLRCFSGGLPGVGLRITDTLQGSGAVVGSARYRGGLSPAIDHHIGWTPARQCSFTLRIVTRQTPGARARRGRLVSGLTMRTNQYAGRSSRDLSSRGPDETVSGAHSCTRISRCPGQEQIPSDSEATMTTLPTVTCRLLLHVPIPCVSISAFAKRSSSALKNASSSSLAHIIRASCSAL